MSMKQEHLQLLMKTLKKIDLIATKLTGDDLAVFTGQYGRLKTLSVREFNPENIATIARDVSKWM